MRILGIDPGSRFAGVGVIEKTQNLNKYQYIFSGCIKVAKYSWSDRLTILYQNIIEVIQKFSPTVAAIEQIFIAKNPGGALKLGQARGVIILACAINKIPIFEYSARAIKQAIVGYGNAEKFQVQQMVKNILNLNKIPQADSADALAVALTHLSSIRPHFFR